MKKFISLLLLAGTIVSSGCAMVMTPATGFVYSDLKGPGTVTPNSDNPKVGKSECESILGIIATGDASIERAAKNGGITKIKTVDYEIQSFLGVYAKLTTVVTGE